jgi:hypothetical protein
MSLALTVRAMVAAGCSTEQVAAVAAAYEAEAEAKRATKRENGAARQRRFRERNAGNALHASRNASNALPPQDKKEKIPHTPLKEKNSTPHLALASLALVDEPVDALQRKRIERAESDQALLDRITDRWNAWAQRHGSPQVAHLTDRRAVHCRRRIADLMQHGHETPEGAFDWLLRKCDTSFYARGSPRKPLEFDQLMREDFMARMVENAFEFHPEKARK